MDENFLSDELIKKRILQILGTIDVEIYKCDKDSALLMACGMMQRSVEILDAQLGEKQRKKILKVYGG